MENKELLSYRSQLIQRLGDTAKVFSETCLAISDPYAPVGVGGWNAHRILSYLYRIGAARRRPYAGYRSC